MSTSIAQISPAGTGSRTLSSLLRFRCRPLMLALVLAGLCVAQGTLRAQADTDADTTGEDGVPFEFLLPTGWTFDQESAAAEGAVAVFYPAGSTWKSADAVIYLKVTEKKEGETLEDLVRADSGSIMKELPGATSGAAGPLRTVDGKIAPIRAFSGGKNGRHQAVAYIDDAENVISLALSARTKEAFDGAREPFEFLVGAFHIPR